MGPTSESNACGLLSSPWCCFSGLWPRAC